MFLIPRNFFFENVRRIASLATFTITNLSGTIEKGGTERTVRKYAEHRNELRQKAKNRFIADK
jgi:hypothetical protein